jgi:hypothetical protein
MRSPPRGRGGVDNASLSKPGKSGGLENEALLRIGEKFQWLENRPQKFPMIGKTGGKSSNDWKNLQKSFQ